MGGSTVEEQHRSQLRHARDVVMTCSPTSSLARRQSAGHAAREHRHRRGPQRLHPITASSKAGLAQLEDASPSASAPEIRIAGHRRHPQLEELVGEEARVETPSLHNNASTKHAVQTHLIKDEKPTNAASARWTGCSWDAGSSAASGSDYRPPRCSRPGSTRKYTSRSSSSAPPTHLPHAAAVAVPGAGRPGQPAPGLRRIQPGKTQLLHAIPHHVRSLRHRGLRALRVERGVHQRVTNVIRDDRQDQPQELPRCRRPAHRRHPVPRGQDADPGEEFLPHLQHPSLMANKQIVLTSLTAPSARGSRGSVSRATASKFSDHRCSLRPDAHHRHPPQEGCDDRLTVCLTLEFIAPRSRRTSRLEAKAPTRPPRLAQPRYNRQGGRHDPGRSF